MDQEYRQHIAGSPYLEEGIGSRLKARASNAISAGQAAMGQQMDSPQQAKLKSLWEGFIASLKRLLADVNDQVSPLIQHRQANYVDPQTGEVSSPVTVQQKDMLDSLNDLYRMVEPNRPMVKVPRRYDYSSNLSQSGVNQGTGDATASYPLSQIKKKPVETPATKASLKEVIGESAWDALKRAFSKGGASLTKAIVSRDPNKILNAYKKAISDIYSEFVKDASKVGIPASMVPVMTKRLYHPQKYKDVMDKIESVMEKPDLGIPDASKGQINQPQAGQPAPSPEQGTQTTQQQPQAGQPTTAQPTGQGPEQGAMEPSDQGALGDQPHNVQLIVSNEDYARIVNKVIELLISAVKSDERSAAFFEYPVQSYSQWGVNPNIYHQQQKLKKADGQIEEAATQQPEDTGIKPHVSPKKVHRTKEELPNQFLYNIGGKKDKYANFSVDATPIDPGQAYLTLSDGTKVKVQAIWNNKGRQVDIVAKVTYPNGRIDQQVVLRFFDDQGNSKTETGKKFGIETLLSQADPKSVEKIKSAEAKAPNEVANIYKLSNGPSSPLGRAVFASVYRKAMEHKGVQEESSLKVLADGSVEDEKGNKMTKSDIASIIWGEDKTEAKSLTDRLNAVGYFEANPKMKAMNSFPAVKESILALQAYEYGNKSEMMAKVAFAKALDHFENPNDIKPELIVKLALNPNDPVTKFIGHGQKTTPKPASTSTPNPAKTTEPEPAKNGEPATAGPAPTPEPEATATPQGKTPEDQLSSVNAGLKEIGVDGLESPQQLKRFFNMKGAWNTKVKNKAQATEKQAYSKLVLGKKPDASQKKLWARLVAKAKEAPKEKKPKAENPQKPQPRGFTAQGPTVAERFVNPFQKANFL